MVLGLIQMISFAQTDSLQQGKVQYGKVGLKVTPSQFWFGEEAATVELKLWNQFSAELKLGVFGNKKEYPYSVLTNNAADWYTSGYVLQTGFKYYYSQKRGTPNLRTPKPYQGFYFQGLVFYKSGTFSSKRISEAWEENYRVESHSIHTLGTKLQFGYEWQFCKYGYLDTYCGIGVRLQDKDLTIEYDSQVPESSYPIEQHEQRLYPTPQLGINIGILVPFKK